MGELGYIEGQRDGVQVVEGTWRLDHDDWLLYAMLCDPIFCAELLFEDPRNHTHGGVYTVYDYQYPLFRPPAGYAAFPCGRSTGKSESLKAKAVTHAFKRMGEDMLVTAPELIHLEALTQNIESRLTETRLTRDFLKRDAQKTGFTHKPFQVDFADGTRILGRIPRLSGTGVKGVHVPDMVMDECFPAGSLVLTRLGLVAIEDVEKGDLVFTHRNRWRPVTATVTRRRETVVLRGHGHPHLRCSIHHKFWSVTTRAGVRAEDGHERRVFSDPGFTPAIDLAPEGGYPPDNKARYGAHYWATPTEIQDVPMPSMPSVNWDCESFWWLLGFYLAEGCVSERRQLVFAIHRDEIGEVTEALDEIGVEWSVDSDHSPLAARVRLKGKVAKGYVTFIQGHLGRVAAEKQVPVWLYDLPERERRLVLEGYIWGDGNQHADRRYSPGRWQASCRDRPLALTIKLLAQTLGYSVTMYWVAPRETEIRGRSINGTGWYQLLGATRSQTHERDGQRFAQVKEVQRTGENELLYDLTVADDHSFVVEGLTVSNSQDFPSKGYTEVHEVVMKDHIDSSGQLDFTYHLYGVHSGAAGGRFEQLAESGEFKVTAVTALMRPGWNRAEKAAAAAMYGGTHSPDYRRNILGEPGTALSQFFVSGRLMAALDQDPDSFYNTVEFKEQHLTAEEVDKMTGPGGDVASLLDLPTNLGSHIYGGMDVGLINDPTVIMLFTVAKDKDKKERLKLVRMIFLWRFRERQIREVAYRIDTTYGKTLRQFGQDITGMGLPLLQAMEDDERCPNHLREISRGYTFNAMVPVAVDEDYVSEQGDKKFDQYGNMVKEERDKWTGQTRYVSQMTMIEASTRYLRNMVDTGYLQLPFHQGLVKDMQGETEQRVRAMGSPHLRKKPSAFHMLDAMRAMAMAYKASEVEATVLQPAGQPVLDIAMDLTPGVGGGMELG